MSIFIKQIVLLLSIILVIQSCDDMELQKSYDFDTGDHRPVKSGEFDMTAYGFMTQHAEFDSMIVAINEAGLQNIYDGGEDNRTFLLLRNEAMAEFLNNHGNSAIAQVPDSTLENMLRYHVIQKKFTQEDLASQKTYVYQTLIEGNDGLINVWKWRRYWQLQLNQNGSLPSTAKGATVYLHNYRFTNGVGHHMKNYVRRVPF